MFQRLRRFIESVIYAGLKPYSQQAQASGAKQGPLRALWSPIERFLAGGPAPSDPLYLSNRTWRQKLRPALVIAIPALLLCVALVLGFSRIITPRTKPPHEPTAAELIAKVLPDVEKTARIDAYNDAEISEIEVDRSGPPRLVGMLKNKTDRVISVEFVVELTSRGGSRLGSVTERVMNAMPQSSTKFLFPLPATDAAFALVREIHASR